MDNIWIWAGVAVVAFVVAPALGGVFHSKERSDQFTALGDIQGMPIAEIVNKVGQPNSISAALDGGQLYQWTNQVGFSGTHFAILVDSEGNAIGYTHQARS